MVGNINIMAEAYAFKTLIKENFENTFKFLGENENSATLIACSIAVFKGIFRPLFTMMDKKSDPESRKYAAIREGLTEVAALPLYATTPWLVGKLVDKYSKQPDPLAQKRIKMTSKFLGICAATIIIPAVCNVIQPPIMNAYKRHQDAKKAKMEELSNQVQLLNISKPIAPVTTINKPLAPKANYGMKVGG